METGGNGGDDAWPQGGGTRVGGWAALISAPGWAVCQQQVVATMLANKPDMLLLS